MAKEIKYGSHIPGLIYHMIVRNWALAKGLPFFYYKDQVRAKELYEEQAKLLN